MIWITPNTLASLKARAAASDPLWLNVKAVADRAPDWDGGIINPALAYVITGDPSYAAKAWSLMSQSMAAGVNQVTPDSGYQARNFFPAACICYSWLRPWLSPTQLLSLRNSIEVCSDWIWPITNPSRAHQWGVDDDMAGNNYWAAFLLTWLAGLTLGSDSPKAKGYVDFARSQWRRLAVPYMQGPAAGGLYAEGTGYGYSTIMELLQSLLGNLSETGEDLIASTPFFEDVVSATIQFNTPDCSQMAPFGDLGAGPVADRHRIVMRMLSAHDPRCTAWLNSIPLKNCSQRLNQWAELLWATPPSNNAADPLSYIAPGVGAVSSRNGWSGGCVQLVTVCGATRESHQDRAQGTFYLFGGDWLAATAKLFSHTGIRQDCWDHNCITVDGARQTWTQDQCHYLLQEDTPAYTFLQMDLTAAYPGLSKYIREVFWIKPNLLLVRDIPVPLAPTSQIVWNLNVLNQPVVDSKGFTVVADGGAKLFGVSDPHLFTAAQVPLEQSQTRSSYRLTLPPGQDFEFLVGLEPAPASQAARTVVPFIPAGLQGMCNGQQMVAAITGSLPLTYTSPVTGMHTLYGLKPGGLYSSPGGSLTASPAGVLSFIGNATGQPVTISEGGVIPPPTPGARNFMIHVPADPAVPATLVEVQPSADE